MRLCHRKWLRLFSLKFQRNNQQNALTIGFAKGKTGEIGCIFTTLWDETTAYYDRAIYNLTGYVFSLEPVHTNGG